MSNETLSMQYPAVDSAVARMKSAVTKMQSETANATNEMNKVESVFKSETSIVYREQYDSLSAKFPDFIAASESFYNALNNAKEVKQQADKQRASQAKDTLA